ncbi:hypothetical protein GWK47_043235 [Chionoecetes opilio]|uniref:Uncharacterized protein n=1 Tax=Chionoecetes opilio TaxID=41210 RepID=A0A8J5CYQ5_CHIOP|nr:hypothetical protein GWK47_043235 [Chionoecetes opilio]
MAPLAPTILVLLHIIPVDLLSLPPQGLPHTQAPHTPSTTPHTTLHKPSTTLLTHPMAHTMHPTTLPRTLIPTRGPTHNHTQALTRGHTQDHTLALTLVPTLAHIQDPMGGHPRAPMEALTAMVVLTPGHTWASTVAAAVMGRTVVPMVGRMGATTEGRPTFKPQRA